MVVEIIVRKITTIAIITIDIVVEVFVFGNDKFTGQKYYYYLIW